jgi:hypothetical protein
MIFPDPGLFVVDSLTHIFLYLSSSIAYAAAIAFSQPLQTKMEPLKTEYVLDPRADLKLILRKPGDEEDEPVTDEEEDDDDHGVEDDELSEDRTRNADESDHQMDASPDVETDTSRIVTIHVSSRHLVLRSKVFEAMLEGAFRESGELRKGTSTFSLNLPEDDAAAFLIVLNIIHGKNRQVPRELTRNVDEYMHHRGQIWVP